MTNDNEQVVTVTLTITAMDLESALVLMEEAENNIEQGSLAGVIGGKMGQVLFSVDQLDPRSPTLRAPVQSAIELLRRLRAHFDGCDDTYIKPLLQEVDAVLKTAGGG